MNRYMPSRGNYEYDRILPPNGTKDVLGYLKAHLDNKFLFGKVGMDEHLLALRTAFPANV